MMNQVIEKKKALGKRECARIYKEAYAAGLEAGKEVGVPKFIVGDAIGLSNEIDYSKKTYVLEGLCGFAWVNVSPARGAFVNYLKSINAGHKAGAFAKVLNSYGINASAGSRLD